MKQLVFSYVDPKVNAIMVSYGDFTEDGFKPHDMGADLSFLFPSASSLIHNEPIFQSSNYVLPKDFDAVFHDILPLVVSVVYYPNVLVLSLDLDDYGTEKEE